MNARAKTLAKEVTSQILDRSKEAAKELANQIVKLSDPSTANYKVSTAASMLFLSIYEFSPEEAYVANALALLGFTGSTVMAIRQFGAENAYHAMSQGVQYGYQAVANKMMTLFKPASNPQTINHPAENLELRTKKTM